MKTLFLIIALFISYTLFAQSSWKPLGSNGGLVSELASARSLFPGIATDTAGTPYIVYMDVSDSSTLIVKKFDGVKWVTVGNLGYHLRGGLASLFISKKDSIYVGYFDNNDSLGRPAVIKFDGTNWVQVGSHISIIHGSYYELSLAVDDNDKVYLGYGAYSSGPSYPPGKANIFTFDGTTWIPVGNTDFVKYSGRMSLRIGLNNELYVGYNTYYLTGNNSTNSWVQKYDGTAWDTVGTSLYPIYNIDIAPDGTLYAMDDEANHGVSVKKLVSNGWVLQGNTYQYYPGGVLVIDKNNIPHIVVGSGVIKYNGINWDGYSDTLVTHTNYISTSQLAFGKNNTPYVTGRNGSSQNEKIFAFYYDSILVNSINSVLESKTLSIYPNPIVKGQNLMINIPSLQEGNYFITVYNTLGQQVYQQPYHHLNGKAVMTVAITSLSSGSYYLKLSDGKKHYTASIIIEE